MSARFLNLPSLQVIKDPFFRKPPRKKMKPLSQGKLGRQLRQYYD